jgi:hypothetical protein
MKDKVVHIFYDEEAAVVIYNARMTEIMDFWNKGFKVVKLPKSRPVDIRDALVEIKSKKDLTVDENCVTLSIN